MKEVFLVLYDGLPFYGPITYRLIYLSTYLQPKFLRDMEKVCYKR